MGQFGVYYFDSELIGQQFKWLCGHDIPPADAVKKCGLGAIEIEPSRTRVIPCGAFETDDIDGPEEKFLFTVSTGDSSREFKLVALSYAGAIEWMRKIQLSIDAVPITLTPRQGLSSLIKDHRNAAQRIAENDGLTKLVALATASSAPGLCFVTFFFFFFLAVLSRSLLKLCFCSEHPFGYIAVCLVWIILRA